MSQRGTPGRGRPPQLSVPRILHAGRTLGMAGLSMNAVASELGVSPTALYRHVQGRWELEVLVGESILDELRVPDDPADDTETHLRLLSDRMFTFTLEHPGMASYLGVLFPRGTAGRRLMASEVTALTRRGYPSDVALVLCTATATLTVAQCASLESKADAVHRDEAGYSAAMNGVIDDLSRDDQLGPLHAGLPAVRDEDYVRMVLAAAIRGLVSVAPLGRPLPDIVAELSGMPLLPSGVLADLLNV